MPSVKTRKSRPKKRAPPPRKAEMHTCERCGSFDARQFGEHWLCANCYDIAGSCCLEFGGDDLWKGVLDEKPD